MIRNYRNFHPKIGEAVYIAENATVIGRVHMDAQASVWFGAVVRGDNGDITIGKRTNIQDNATLHCTSEKPLIVGDDVAVGHNVVLHSCKIGNHCLIGMGAVVMNDAVIGENSIVGAGALVTEGKVFPPNALIVGAPAKVKRILTAEDCRKIDKPVAEYLRLSREYAAQDALDAEEGE